MQQMLSEISNLREKMKEKAYIKIFFKFQALKILLMSAKEQKGEMNSFFSKRRI